MEEKNTYSLLLSILSSSGADFSEVFYEDKINRMYRYTDSILDNISIDTSKGFGFRIEKEGDVYYSSNNDLEIESLKESANDLKNNFDGKSDKIIELSDLIIEKDDIKLSHEKFSTKEKKDILQKLDKSIREYSDLITQVSLGFVESDRTTIVANSEGKFIKYTSAITRFICNVYTKNDTQNAVNFVDKAVGVGYEFLEDINLEEICLNCARIAVEKLDAVTFKGGKLPVILCPGFGAVIFHEACGHGLEATSVAPNISVFSGDLNEKVASDKVTLIDDGTLCGMWGSNIVDDEGEYSRKNILIENGILKNYLVDKLNSKKMKMNSNGCGRRENYLCPPTSRMSNTYLKPGTDKIEDMIKSIKLGIYCEKMSGGSVNPSTGEFNFAVDSAFVIRDGKIAERVKGITLIGTSKEILKNVEMVSDDLEISGGYCGSSSGTIPVTIGQPTVKIKEILVGGM